LSQFLFFEDLEVGQRWQSRGRTITEADVVNFAGLTGDYDPLHVDHEFVKQTPYGRPIAHGLLGLSWVAGLSSQCPTVRTLAFTAVREWEFLAPMYIGDTVHALTEVVTKEASGRRSGRVVWKRQLFNQHGAVVQGGTFETLVALRSAEEERRRDAPRNLVPPPPHVFEGEEHRTPRASG
jgi:3-hydroxybutyryl-CoA dehydratase